MMINNLPATVGPDKTWLCFDKLPVGLINYSLWLGYHFK